MMVMTPDDYKDAIQMSGHDIYTPIQIDDPKYWVPAPQLEALLNRELRGKSLAGMPIRTRSKNVKEAVCKALGYPVPNSFKKSQPRFFSQQLDIYVQKSMNLQVWNEEISATRRYAIIQVSEQDLVLKVRVISGQELALLDTTGTITTKYQAGLELRNATHELVSVSDTHQLQVYVHESVHIPATISPVSEPDASNLLAIRTIYNKLSLLIGQSFADPGAVQERNRGAGLHQMVCQQLGYSRYEDNGQFPDVRHQLLEIKLQTSPTIDLGLILPNSQEPLAVQSLAGHRPRHCDTRYAIFVGKIVAGNVQLTNLYVSTGVDFFTRFRRFEGNVVNRKIQIRLPSHFFTG